MLSVRCLSVTFMHCGQTVGRIKMKLGIQVGLGPGHTVLGGSNAAKRSRAGQGRVCRSNVDYAFIAYTRNRNHTWPRILTLVRKLNELLKSRVGIVTYAVQVVTSRIWCKIGTLRCY